MRIGHSRNEFNTRRKKVKPPVRTVIADALKAEAGGAFSKNDKPKINEL